jgi:hypothetical protein
MIQRRGYRWVFNPIDGTSFQVVAQKTANRFKVPPCEAYALSLYETEEQARAAFAKQLEKNPDIRQDLGTHIAEIALAEDHGLQTQSNSIGHFGLHEFQGVDLVAVARLMKPL